MESEDWILMNFYMFEKLYSQQKNFFMETEIALKAIKTSLKYNDIKMWTSPSHFLFYYHHDKINPNLNFVASSQFFSLLPFIHLCNSHLGRI